MRLYLIRHGETTLNEKGCYYGWTDVPLNKKGEDQAIQLQKEISKLQFDRIFVSPLLRAKQTAIIAASCEEKDCIMDERLKEHHFGIFEGYTYREIIERFPEEMDHWNQDYYDYCIPQGESFAEVRKRVDDFAADLPSGKGQILIAAHKGTLGHLVASLLHMPLEGYWNFVFEQGCYSCIDLEDGYAIIRKLNEKVGSVRD